MITNRAIRRATAVASLGLAALALTGCSLISTVLNGGEADVFTLKVGDCLNDQAKSGDIDSLPTVDCKKPHDSEIYASVILDDGDYPGDEAIGTTADDECYGEFADFVGVSFDESKYTYATIFPTEDSWGAGDREVLCRIVLADENGAITQVTGSLEGVGE